MERLMCVLVKGYKGKTNVCAGEGIQGKDQCMCRGRDTRERSMHVPRKGYKGKINACAGMGYKANTNVCAGDWIQGKD